MFSSNHMKMLMKKVMDQLDIDIKEENNGNNKNTQDNSKNSCLPNLAPVQIVVILALLGGILEVDSVFVDKDQVIEIVLGGSLKRKTELEKQMDQVGTLPFDDVMRALLGRY